MATLATTNIKHASSSSNNIVLASDGSTAISGHVVQVVTTIKNDIFSTTATSSANGGTDGLGLYNDGAVQVTGLTAAITPKSASNILIVDIFSGSFGSTNDNYVWFWVTKDGNYVSAWLGDKLGTNSNRMTAQTRPADNARMEPLGIRVHETAGSTSARTYGLKMLGGAGTSVIGTTGAHFTGSNATNGLYLIGSCPSTITVTEIAA